MAIIPTLETDRLRLRPVRDSDFEAYAALYSDPEVLRHLGTEPWDRGRAWRHLAYVIGHWQLGGWGEWAVEERVSGDFVGMVGYSAPEGWPGFELGWILARRWWGRGYATEAARAALDYAFDEWRRDCVISLIAPQNHASVRVAERIGEVLQDRIDHFGREMLRYVIDRGAHEIRRQGRGADSGRVNSSLVGP